MKTRRILLVEGNQGQGKGIVEILKGQVPDAEVVWVRSGEEAGERLRTNSYSLVLLDSTLPKGSAFELLDRWRQTGTVPPFVVLSGMRTDRVAATAFRQGALDYVVTSAMGLTNLVGVVEAALHSAEEAAGLGPAAHRYMELVEQARDAITFLDMQGRITFVNRRAEVLTGYRRQELLNQPIQAILPEDGEKILRADLRRQKHVRWDKNFEVQIRAKDGTPIPVELTISPLMQRRKLAGFEVIARDIRERKQAQSKLEERDARIQRLNLEIQKKNMQLEESSRVQTEFVANISHEFRTPLNGILGYADLLLDDVYGELNDKQRAALTNIRHCALSLFDLVQKVLDLSKLKSNQLKLEYEYCSPYDLIEATAGTIEPIVRSKGLKLIRHCEEGLSVIRVDFKRIYQVLVNLAANAVKFTHEGHVELGALRTSEGVQFYVQDTGIGIQPEDQEKIFQEFRQLDSSTTRIYGGIGVGLSLSKKLVELHEGSLGLESAPNEGSRFHFTLPLIHENFAETGGREVNLQEAYEQER